ncbi:MAG: hypothetical protein J5752_08915 [Clostridiales bacterium]|nr:hypothetical protein [Clostridiales bacterium]
MSEKEPFLVKAADQEKLEEIAGKTNAGDVDYKKIFDETDPIRENMVSLVASKKSEDPRVLPSSGEEMANITGDTKGYIQRTEENMNMIATTHSGKGKKLFLKVAGWPARRYLDPQIKYNECSVRINEDILKMVDVLKRDSATIQQESKDRQDALLSVCSELASHMELMKKRIQELEVLVADLERKNQELEDRLDSADGRN